MRPDTYRPDIDGLRAISDFHLGFSGFSDGFVGVDIIIKSKAYFRQ